VLTSCMMNLYVKNLLDYLFIEVVLKTYLDKLYFYKLYNELMHQSCSPRSFVEVMFKIII